MVSLAATTIELSVSFDLPTTWSASSIGPTSCSQRPQLTCHGMILSSPAVSSVSRPHVAHARITRSFRVR
jgi:hypothetical protein